MSDWLCPACGESIGLPSYNNFYAHDLTCRLRAIIRRPEDGRIIEGHAVEVVPKAFRLDVGTSVATPASIDPAGQH